MEESLEIEKAKGEMAPSPAQIAFNYTLRMSVENLAALANGFTAHRVSKKVHQVHIDEILAEAQDIIQLSNIIYTLNEHHQYSEALTLIRGLLEKSFHFFLSVTEDRFVSYEILQSEEDLVNLNAVDGMTAELCGCQRRGEGVCAIITRTKLDDGSQVLPGMRFVQLGSRDPMAHTFPRNYRRDLWSYLREREIRQDFNYRRDHYLDWKRHIQEGLRRNLITEHDHALFSSHYGFLSAIAHSVVSLKGELHERNAPPQSFALITERLVLLYLYSLLALVFQPLAKQAHAHGYWDDEFIERVKLALVHTDLVGSELQFPFAPEHPFEVWQVENVRRAIEIHHIELHDLEREHLTDNFLDRLRALHTPNQEISTGMIWTPQSCLH